MKHFLFLRHGQIEESYRGLFYGQMDVPLSEEGKRKSLEVVDILSEIPIRAIYSSPLQRALFPAKLLAQKKSLSLHLREELKEINYGEWTGQPREIIIQNPLFWERLKNENLSPPGGESLKSLRERARKFWEELKNLEEDGFFTIFTHGGFIRALLCEILNLHTSFFFAFETYHLKGPLITCFEDGNFVIRGINFDIQRLSSLLKESYW